MAERAFEEIEKLWIENVMLHCPDFNKTFDIHTDSSEYQMGAVISQNGKPVVYWSKKLTKTQRKYPTIDQELLVIVECLKQYKIMLLRQNIIVWMDHQKMTYKNTEDASDRVLCQILLLKEYGVALNGFKEG